MSIRESLHTHHTYSNVEYTWCVCKVWPEACNFIKQETLAQVVSCEFWKIFKNSFFTEHIRETASEETYRFSFTVIIIIQYLMAFIPDKVIWQNFGFLVTKMLIATTGRVFTSFRD